MKNLKFKLFTVVYIPSWDKIGLIDGFTGYPSMPYHVKLQELYPALKTNTLVGEDFGEHELVKIGDLV